VIPTSFCRSWSRNRAAKRRASGEGDSTKLSKLLPIGILCALAAGGPARGDEGVATGVGTRFSQTSTPLTNDQWTVAIEKQIFHHRFAVWMGNTQATTVDQYIGGDYAGGITDRNMKIGFNLSRAWDLSPAN